MKQNFLMRNIDCWAFAGRAFFERFWQWMGFGVYFYFLVFVSLAGLFISSFFELILLSSTIKNFVLTDNTFVQIVPFVEALERLGFVSHAVLVGAFIVSIVLLLYMFSLCIQLYRVATSRLMNEQTQEIIHLCSFNWSRAFQWFIVGILLVVPIILGFLLFIFPGFYLCCRVLFFPVIFAINPSVSAFQAIAQSWRLTRGRVKEVAWFLLSSAFFHLIGGRFFIAILSMVLYSFSLSCFYKKFTENT